MRKLTLALLITLIGGLAFAQTQIRWYVGLGAGTDEPTIAAQQGIVDEFNASQDEIELVLEIVDNDQAYDILATQSAAGNAPDIVGPMGSAGALVSKAPGAISLSWSRPTTTTSPTSTLHWSTSTRSKVKASSGSRSRCFPAI